MARFAKTICDRCGREHVDGTVDDIYIRPLVLSAGTSANATAYTTKNRDLCMGCRDAILTSLTLLMDEKAPHRDARGGLLETMRRKKED